MEAVEILEDCMRFYQLPVLHRNGNRITTIKGYMVEAEADGVYKLVCDGMVVAPFNDLNELCTYIINY